MTLLLNNFDGGPDGTAVSAANSGQALCNDAFEGIVNTGGGFLDYSVDVQRPTAEFTMKASVTVSGVAVCYWTTSMGSQSQTWHRVYFYMTELPSGGQSPTFFASEASNGKSVSVGINTNTYQVYVQEINTLGSAQTTGTVTTGQWYRLEARFQWSLTTGNADVRWFEDADAEEPTETIGISGKNFGATASINYYFGLLRGNVNMDPMYLSGIGLSSEDWIGPAPFRPGKGVPGVMTNPTAIHTAAW